MQQEFPNAGVRTSAQLFSFHGDDFPSKPTKSSKFECINTKWFYTQFGDSNGTGGRAQDIIPLQDTEGRVLGGGVSLSGEAATNAGASNMIEGLKTNLLKMQEWMQGNAKQIQSLAEVQSNNQARMDRIESIVEENSKNIEALTKVQSAIEERTRDGAEENTGGQLEALAKEQAAGAEQLRQVLQQMAKVSEDMTHEFKQQRQKGQRQSQGSDAAATTRTPCPHNVRPPPRKIDKLIVGYDYGRKVTAADVRFRGAKKPSAPSSKNIAGKVNSEEKKRSI